MSNWNIVQRSDNFISAINTLTGEEFKGSNGQYAELLEKETVAVLDPVVIPVEPIETYEGRDLSLNLMDKTTPRERFGG